MLTMIIEKMKCGGCAANVEKAIKGVDANARVSVDLDTKRVDVDTQADSQAIITALDTAGFTAKAA